MSKAVLYMSMSVDGFIAGPNDGPDNGLGDGGHRLHDWLLIGADSGHKEIIDRLDGVNREVVDEFMSTGRSSSVGGPSSPPAAGTATTTTAYRSSS